MVMVKVGDRFSVNPDYVNSIWQDKDGIVRLYVTGKENYWSFSELTFQQVHDSINGTTPQDKV